jgi:hypothetical protein
MPQLNGLLLQLPGAAPIFLVLNGYRCWIPDMPTFQGVFAAGATVIQDINIGVVSEGPAIISGAVCASAAKGHVVTDVTFLCDICTSVSSELNFVVRNI